MTAKPNKLILIIAFTLTICIMLFPAPVFAGKNETAATISAAENKIALCYTAVSSASNAGANVSTLTAKLTDAGTLLSQAEADFLSENYTGASLLAEQCLTLLNGTEDEAATLKHEAETQKTTRLIWTISFTCVGIALLSASGFFSWKRLKKYYLKQIMRQRPEEVPDK